MLIAGDIGGTNTRMALYELQGEQLVQLVAKNYPSREYGNLTEIAAHFKALAQQQVRAAALTQAVFGLAGPVDRLRGECITTNLPWHVKATELKSVLGIDAVYLLNDVESISYGVLHLGTEDVVALNRNPEAQQADSKGNKVLIAPGTGLGEAILVYDWQDNLYHISATEGGHADFAPRNQFEMGLLRHLHDKFWDDSFGHISYERVISGQGIGHIYDYLKESFSISENPQVAMQLQQAKPDKRAAIISEAATRHQSELCMTTMTTFVSILGAEAGNMALKTLAYGGVYLGGGIPPKIIEKLEDGSFMAAFVNKGRFANVMARIPVYVIVRDEPGLFGAACYAQFHAAQG
ncbi:MAG: glucokinase [Chloroflexi bacterium]|nr:glucokinase [Chloroflexota bacterium]